MNKSTLKPETICHLIGQLVDEYGDAAYVGAPKVLSFDTSLPHVGGFEEDETDVVYAIYLEDGMLYYSANNVAKRLVSELAVYEIDSIYKAAKATTDNRNMIVGLIRKKNAELGDQDALCRYTEGLMDMYKAMAHASQKV